MGRGKRKSTKREKDTHHYYHPKKLYKHNKLMTLPYELHHSYHNFFMAHCKYPPRTCKGCGFALICCYEGTNVAFGQKVM